MATLSTGHDGLRIFLLTAHNLLREQLRELLENEGMEIVADSASAFEAARSIPLLKPDVALLDLVVADGNGIEVCQGARESSPRTHCIILASFFDAHAFREASRAGASAFVLRGIRDHGLPAAIRLAAQGESLMEPQGM
jgi:DNA-binding NarL/FixJ family response regulator